MPARALPALLLAALALAGPLALAHHTGTAGQYVGAVYVRLGVLNLSVQTGVCQDLVLPPPAGNVALPFGVAQVCYLTAPDATDLTITVRDAFTGPVGFRWIALTDGDHILPCDLAGDAFGSVTVSLPDFCRHILVRPALGSVMGTVTLS